MTIKKLVEIAFVHFCTNNITSQQTRERIMAYATEQLELSGTTAALFTLICDKHVDRLADAMDLEEFFIWYYINFMARPVG